MCQVFPIRTMLCKAGLQNHVTSRDRHRVANHEQSALDISQALGLRRGQSHLVQYSLSENSCDCQNLLDADSSTNRDKPYLQYKNACYHCALLVTQALLLHMFPNLDRSNIEKPRTTFHFQMRKTNKVVATWKESKK